MAPNPNETISAVSREELENAISTTDLDVLRYLVRKLCDEVPEARRIVEDEIMILEDSDDDEESDLEGEEGEAAAEEEDSEDEEGAESSDEDEEVGGNDDEEEEDEGGDDDDDDDDEAEEVENQPQPTQGIKRHRGRYGMCLKCRQDYDVTDNDEGGCNFHDGHPYPDDDFFADDDGDVNTDWHKEEYPEGFVWSCCQATGIDSDGCKTGRHVEDQNYVPSSKKPKVWQRPS